MLKGRRRRVAPLPTMIVRALVSRRVERVLVARFYDTDVFFIARFYDAGLAVGGCQEQGGDEPLHRAVCGAACSTPRRQRSGTNADFFSSQ